MKVKRTVGIEWLGEVPEHWEVKKLKHILLRKKDSIKVGPFGSQLTTRDMEGVDIKVINQRNVIDNNFDFGDNFINHEKYIELRAFHYLSWGYSDNNAGYDWAHCDFPQQ